MSEPSVYDRIREKIIRNEILPGERVGIDALVRELGVSQTPVREALHRLEGERLVTRARGRGYSTTPLLDEARLREMFEVRMLLEPWSARVVSVDRASNPGLQLIELVESFRESHRSLCSRADLATHDLEFHRLINRATGNRFLRNAYAGLHAQLHLFRLYAEDVDSSETLDEHRSVAEAIAACDGPAAESSMRSHLQCALQRFLPLLGADPAAADRAMPATRRILPPR